MTSFPQGFFGTHAVFEFILDHQFTGQVRSPPVSVPKDITTESIEKWKMPVQNWPATLQQLTIIFGERVRSYTNI